MSPPKTLSNDQCDWLTEQLLVTQGTQKQVLKGIRNHAAAVVMLETGIRVGELCALLIDDLWFADQPVSNLTVRQEIAKNKKERQIPISQKLCAVLKRMHSKLWSPENFNTTDFAFSSGANGRPLTTRTVERIIGNAGMIAFGSYVTPHLLRHTFASRMMKKTNARIVQALLGHSSLQSTQIYMHPDLEDLKNAINS